MYTLIISYVSYQTQEIPVDATKAQDLEITLSLLASFSASNGQQTMRDAFFRTLEAGGSTLDLFNYNSYAEELKLGALANLSYTLRTADRIGYTFFYSRNIVDTYMRREGTDYEDHNLIGNNNTTHIYSLQNH